MGAPRETMLPPPPSSPGVAEAIFLAGSSKRHGITNGQENAGTPYVTVQVNLEQEDTQLSPYIAFLSWGALL